MTSESSDVEYRPAKRDDFATINSLIRVSFDNLLKEHGFVDISPFASHRLPPVSGPFPWFELGLKEDAKGFWVAEIDGELAGVALSWVRKHLWYLAHLFVSPNHQGHGIGRKLMDLAMQNKSELAITNRALVTLAYNPVSISLYSRYGIYPREPVYWMECPNNNVKPRTASAGLSRQRAENFRSVREKLTAIDEACIGYPREKNHEFLFSLPSYKCYSFHSLNDEPVGYAYVAQNGRVGPVATSSEKWFKDTVVSAIGLAAAENSPSVSLAVSGSNSVLVNLALGYGMKIRDNFLFMAAKPFPNFNRYVLYPTGAML